MNSFDVVIPTCGRPELRVLLGALAAASWPRPRRVLVVDDRPQSSRPAPLIGRQPAGVELVPGPARGPAAARNAGWRAASADWVAFLDDDTVPGADWAAQLDADLAAAPDDCAAVQGTIRVPLGSGPRPTDWERNVRGLETALWATADMAFRRAALESVGGFDERFARAYREDCDIALRLLDAGWTLTKGTRMTMHPVRPESFGVSLRLQAGNADDVLMTHLHGPGWRERAGAPTGRLRRHALITTAAGAGLLAAGARARRSATLAGLCWLGGVGELAWTRIAPGPRTPAEIFRMLATSAVLPFWANAWWLRGQIRLRRLSAFPAAVLFDRDGTLVEDVPYNGDPSRVRPMPGAAQALARLRHAGIPVAVISNQSGVARGLLRAEEVEAVNRRTEELLGPLGPWLVCPHDPAEDCSCRKPKAGLVLRAAAALGVDPRRCAVVGDIGADVEAARAAGARGVLVPTDRTRPEEIAVATERAPDLPAAIRLLMGAER
jgi:histidinol-phosphate phosphatase family protein